jgi:transposase InsO family protein
VTIYTWIQQHREAFAVKAMCRVLGVSRAAFYAWVRDPHRSRDDSRRVLAEKIGQIRQEPYMTTYGSPRMAEELLARGVSVSENTVARAMKEAGLRADSAKRFVPCTTDSDHAHPVAPNRLDRDFTAAAPDRKWLTDITYVPTREGWLYLAGVLDACSRKIVGWSMDTTMKAELVVSALDMALARRNPTSGLLHHSDRGSQYACEKYQSLLAEHGITCSMSRPGNCYDNAMKESFWSTLKREAIGDRVFESIAEAKATLFEYIEVFYNRIRRHSSLGYVSPEAFEAAQN